MTEQEGSLSITRPGVGKLNDLRSLFELKFNHYDNLVLLFFSKFSSHLLFKTLFLLVIFKYVLN